MDDDLLLLIRLFIICLLTQEKQFVDASVYLFFVQSDLVLCNYSLYYFFKGDHAAT